MRNKIVDIRFVVCLFLFSGLLNAATVEWANKVFNVSSDNASRGDASYSAQQILGKPNVLPDFGETVCAWSPQGIKRNDYIVVGFPNPINIQQVAIVENLNPGAIVKVTVYGEGKDSLIFSNSKPQPLGRKGRVFNIYCEPTSFKVNQVRIDINTYYYNDNYQIDAVAISDSKDPVTVNINLSKDVIQVSEPENLGPNINSRYSELAPVISPDGKTLYFTRERHPGNTGVQSIWYSSVGKDGKFEPAKNIGEPLNTRYNNFAISILPDGNSMMVGNVYLPGGRMTNGFSMTYRNGDKWSMPERMNLDNLTAGGGKGSYNLASSGKILLSSVQRSGGYGGNDVYVSFLQDNGVWSRPLNLGPTINTADREDSPFLAADGVTLYFSSSGRPSYGSSDIFMSRRLDDSWQKWSEPVNLGNKINTAGWDAYFTITALGDYAYFVSGQNSAGMEDIFRVKLPQEMRPERVVLVEGKVIDKKTNKPLDATIYYERLSDGKSMGLARSNAATGSYKIALPVNEKYGFRAEAKDYIAINENIDLTKLKDDVTEIKRDLYLVPLEKDQTITINNLFFDFGKFDLLRASFPELDRLAKLMKETPTMAIRLEGHTDNVGSAADNKTLSESRVDAVKQYLVAKGGAEDRIKTKGFGATKPIASNKTEEGRAKNRRVECIITHK